MRLMRDLYKDTFLGKRIRLVSRCEIAPVDITGTVTGVTLTGSERVLHVRSERNNKVYPVGENSKDLMYEIF